MEASNAALGNYLEHVTLGDAIRLKALDLVPLVARTRGVDADLLEEALERGTTRVSEVSEGGSVNSVRVEHGGEQPLLLVDGEEIRGAKQNRIFNASFIIAPGVPVDVPVSCVEQGRWRHSSSHFSSGQSTLLSQARGRKLRRVSESVNMCRGFDADQGEVWRDVETYLASTKVSSPTMALADAMEPRLPERQADLERLQPVPGQIGLAVVAQGQLACLDIFGSAALWKRAWRKVAVGALAGADDAGHGKHSATAARRLVEAALAAGREGKGELAEAPGAGKALYVRGRRFVWGAAVTGERVYHAMATAA